MKPERIIIIRHGQSYGNIDKKIYEKIPDYALYLTDLGKNQAKECGQKINKIINNQSYGCYYSPFFRAHQTMDFVVKELNNNCLFKKEEPRIREQEWSGSLRKDFLPNTENERDNYGHFYYRLPNGESCSDVFDRVSDYFNTLFRDFEKKTFPNNCLIFGHGMTNRLILMKWLHITVEEFELWANPKNCEFYILEKNNLNKYDLVTPIRLYKERNHKYQYNPN